MLVFRRPLMLLMIVMKLARPRSTDIYMQATLGLVRLIIHVLGVNISLHSNCHMPSLLSALVLSLLIKSDDRKRKRIIQNQRQKKSLPPNHHISSPSIAHSTHSFSKREGTCWWFAFFGPPGRFQIPPLAITAGGRIAWRCSVEFS